MIGLCLISEMVESPASCLTASTDIGITGTMFTAGVTESLARDRRWCALCYNPHKTFPRRSSCSVRHEVWRPAGRYVQAVCVRKNSAALPKSVFTKLSQTLNSNMCTSLTMNFTQIRYKRGQRQGQKFTYAPTCRVDLTAPIAPKLTTSRADAHR
jgi:hypothetical protein